jgi:small subunit ribosomal protein S4
MSQPTYKVCRRLGSSVFDKCQTQKYTLSETKHSKGYRGRRPNISDFGKQLLEKQRVRFAYGVSERQLRRYVEEANRVSLLGTDPNLRMVEQLELRLDNVVYRIGLAPSRRAARQLVTHGHVLVNGVRTDVPSRTLGEGDTVALRDRTKGLPLMERIKEWMEQSSIPAWIQYDVKKHEGALKSRPTLENTEMPGNVGAILEYYSR